MLCVTLTPGSIEEVFSSDLSGADCVEVRLDYLKNPRQSLDVSWTKLGIPMIATCRREERGGRFRGLLQDEVAILEAAARNGASFADMDYRDARPIAGTRIIASYHNFERTPSDIEQHLGGAAAAPAHIAKIATTVRSWDDNRRLLQILSRPWPRPVIVVGMGELGQITRIVGPSRGSFLTYATTRQPSGEPSAAGQISAREMLDVLRFRHIRRSTTLTGVLGNPVEYSLSPQIHNHAFAAAGLDFVYLRFPATDVADFFQNADAIGIHGISITIPHKIAAIPFMSALTPAARNVGAVNTAVRTDDGWLGDNTDVYGVHAAFASVGFSATDKSIVILGKGGAARAAVAATRSAKSVVLMSRADMRDVQRHACDLLINATPVGMYPFEDSSPLDGPIPGGVVFDMVYNPPMTKLLRTAASQGKKIISGTTMFVAQAARQFEIWTGQRTPTGAYR